jgi:thiamine phosphate synthase YjbQ (UPF0047 family)
MRQTTHRFQARTRGAGLYDVTAELTSWVGRQRIETGLLTVFIRHTSASLVIQENADPDVLRDLDAFLRRIVPEERPNAPEERPNAPEERPNAPQDGRLYRHTAEGPDDMPAHIRSALTRPSWIPSSRRARARHGRLTSRAPARPAQPRARLHLLGE